jgi:Tol biopolymer transport system component
MNRMIKAPLPAAVLGLVVAACSAGGTPATTPSSNAGSPTSGPSPATEVDAAAAWIVYQSPDGLWLLAPDGSADRRALPSGPENALHPDWSRDGLGLAFAADDPDGTRDVWISDWDGSNARLLVDCVAPCRDADSPAWSPDGLRIAFTRIDNVDGHNPGSELQVVVVLTGEITTVAATQGAEYATEPRWSPDGRSLVATITRYIDDGNDTATTTGSAIAVLGLDDVTPAFRPITTFESGSWYPDWHPTDALILFTAEEPSDLFTIRPDGTGLTRLTNQRPGDELLSMSAYRPDGSGILVTLLHPEGNLTLGTLGVDGTGLTELGDGSPIPGAHSRQRNVPPT